jgi:pilus assembly protein CpaC
MRKIKRLMRNAPFLLRRATSCLTHVLLEISIAAMLLGAPLGIIAASGAPNGALSMEAGNGKVVTLDGAATNVFVADPKVAEVRPASASTLFVFGVGPGHTTVAALDNTGHLIAQYEVTVLPSHFGANQAQAAIARMIPGGRITVQPAAKGLLLTGQVENPGEAAQAAAIARGFIGDNQAVENQIAIQSSIQVTLQVRIAEMSRQVVRNLGVNWSALGNIGTIAKFSPFAALGLVANSDSTAATSIPAIPGVNNGNPPNPLNLGGSFNAVIDALAQDNLAHILAEPTLTTISGQPASFLVGGEFPIPVSGQNGSITVAFKNFGVALSFVPTVFSDGRISVHVAPEVSSISTQNAVTVAAGSSSFQIPSLVVQRAETTVELGSGQTFAIAGLLQDTVAHNANGLPFLGDVPILGPLFRSDAFNRQQTELVILVTPFVVHPVDDRLALHTPDENYTPPGELDRLLLLHQTGDGHSGTPVRIPGDAGFVVQ